VVGSPEFDILSIIIDACDRAVHSERIDFVTASQIVEIGESAISYIESLPEKSESANKTPGKGKKLTPGGNDF
jgi:hypothetical protein